LVEKSVDAGLDEILALRECLVHVGGHGSGCFRDEAGDQSRSFAGAT
jgi:hypothetical protein